MGLAHCWGRPRWSRWMLCIQLVGFAQPPAPIAMKSRMRPRPRMQTPGERWRECLRFGPKQQESPQLLADLANGYLPSSGGLSPGFGMGTDGGIGFFGFSGGGTVA